jgi:hypothetical protein
VEFLTDKRYRYVQRIPWTGGLDDDGGMFPTFVVHVLFDLTKSKNKRI